MAYLRRARQEADLSNERQASTPPKTNSSRLFRTLFVYIIIIILVKGLQLLYYLLQTSFLVSPYSDGFVPKQAQVAFPALLPDIYKEDMYKQPFNVVLGKCSSVVLDVTQRQTEAVDMATRAQANSRLWPKFRAGRVTASRFYKVCHTHPSQPAPSTIKNICCPDSTPAVRWGIRNKTNAKAAYRKKMTAHLNLFNAGFWVCDPQRIPRDWGLSWWNCPM